MSTVEITFGGAGQIKLSGRGVALLIDPDPTALAQTSKLKADAILLTAPGDRQLASGAMIIDGPGEYEIKGANVIGAPARLHSDEGGQRSTVYQITIDGVRIASLGNIAPGLSNEQLEVLGQVDVLLLPVGGHGLTLDAEAASEIVGQVEPHYVIPTHFSDDKTKYPVPQDAVDEFLHEMGAKSEPVAKFALGNKEAPAETTVVQLQVV